MRTVRPSSGPTQFARPRSNLTICILVIRSVSEDKSIDQLWNDYASCLVVEKRKKGVACSRSEFKYKRREVPNIPEIQDFLMWYMYDYFTA